MPGYELIGKEERDEVLTIFDNSGGVLFRHGFDAQRNGIFKVQEFEKEFVSTIGFPDQYKALAVSSGTAALRVALASLNLKHGSKVLVPSFTFVATYEAIIEAGLTPVAVKIDDKLGMSDNAVEDLIDDNVSAIICVHMLGYPCNIEKIAKICNQRDIKLIEDVAWGLGAEFDGELLGTFGVISCFSFDHAKLITTGEGGMILTKDPDIYSRAAAWHDHGHKNTQGLPRWKDDRDASGFNFRLTEIQAAIGLAQLKKFNKIINFQREAFSKVKKLLDGHDKFRVISRRNTRPSCDAIIIETPNPEFAFKIREKLLSQNIGTKILPEATSWHFVCDWEHMLEKILMCETQDDFGATILHRCVAIPTNFSTRTI